MEPESEEELELELDEELEEEELLDCGRTSHSQNIPRFLLSSLLRAIIFASNVTCFVGISTIASVSRTFCSSALVPVKTIELVMGSTLRPEPSPLTISLRIVFASSALE